MQDFEEYIAYSVPKQGASANQGGTFSILGIGTAHKTVTINGKTSQLLFKLVIHTLDLSANLILVGKFDDLGFSILFKDGATFKDLSGRIFMEGQQ